MLLGWFAFSEGALSSGQHISITVDTGEVISALLHPGPAWCRLGKKRTLIPSGLARYISAARGKQYAESPAVALTRASSSRSRGKIGMSTFSPVLEVFTEMKPSFRSTSDHCRQQQSPRRIAVHMPVITTAPMFGSCVQACNPR